MADDEMNYARLVGQTSAVHLLERESSILNILRLEWCSKNEYIYNICLAIVFGFTDWGSAFVINGA